jgi:hypothetical protein
LSGQQLNLPSLSGQWRFGHSRTYTLCHHLRMDLLSNQSMISSLSSMVRIHFLANQTCYHLCVGMGPVMDCTFFDALKLNGHSCNQRSHSSFGKTWLFHLPLLINSAAWELWPLYCSTLELQSWLSSLNIGLELDMLYG